jgi:hypothetical protein
MIFWHILACFVVNYAVDEFFFIVVAYNQNYCSFLLVDLVVSCCRTSPESRFCWNRCMVVYACPVVGCSLGGVQLSFSCYFPVHVDTL